MRTNPPRLLIAALFAVPLAAAPAVADEDKPTFAVTDKTFEAEVLESDLPVLVDFWAEWCGPCKVIAPTLEELANEYDGRVRVAKLDVDDNRKTTEAYGIRAIPTLLLFNDGEVVETFVGVQPKAKIAKAFDKVAPEQKAEEEAPAEGAGDAVDAAAEDATMSDPNYAPPGVAEDAADAAEDATDPDAAEQAAAAAEADGLVPLTLDLPKPAFKETPKDVPPGIRVEKPRKGPEKPFMVPPGAKNLAEGKPVSASDEEPLIGTLELITNGNKEADEGQWVDLGPGLQWVQIDLEKAAEIHAVVLWHYHGQARVYHDVVVRVSNDSDFVTGVTTLFNNDHDNSAGLGLGEELGFWETNRGKLVDGKVDGEPVTARYVRLYSDGNTSDPMTHYTEVEVWGEPAEATE